MTARNPYKSQIIVLLHTGKSAGEIAAIVGNGVTRNMVAGYRGRGGGAAIFGRQSRGDKKPAMRLAAAEPQPARQFAGKCSYPHGDPRQPRGFHFCGQPVDRPGGPYCAKHWEATHQRPSAPADAGRPLRREWTA